MIHTVRRIILRTPKRRWVFKVMMAAEEEGYDEIERFDDPSEAYAFCSWLNGGERPNLSVDTWERINDVTVPEEEDD